jgi:protocatechuate 3,4-dioxygenase beta subunit
MILFLHNWIVGRSAFTTIFTRDKMKIFGFFSGLILVAMILSGCTSPQGASPTPTTTATIATLPTSPAIEAPTTALPTRSQPTLSQPAATQAAYPTTACTHPAALTPALTEGPYFTPNSPERASLLEAEMPGIVLTLTGYVLNADCQPVANALVDFWQADSQGNYDNEGYTLRGHQFTDANGRYQLETVVPGLYPGRTEHIHVKVQAPNGPILTTQLFFPEVADNQTDRIYDPALLIQIQERGETVLGAYNFIIETQ